MENKLEIRIVITPQDDSDLHECRLDIEGMLNEKIEIAAMGALLRALGEVHQRRHKGCDNDCEIGNLVKQIIDIARRT